MLVARQRWKDGSPDAGTPLSLQQPVERPAKRTIEGGGKGHGLKSRQMQIRADL